MGLLLSPIIANLVIKKLEERVNHIFHSPPCIWFRFVDDVHGIMKSNYIEEFNQHLNTICESIKLTRGEHKCFLAFLYVLIRRVARNSQWGGLFWGLGAKPPAAGGWGFGGKAPSRRRHGGVGAEPPALKNFAFFLQK